MKTQEDDMNNHADPHLVSRRFLIGASAIATLGTPICALSQRRTPTSSLRESNHQTGDHYMITITTKDGTSIYFKDWGSGQPVVFSHGWPLNADAWDAQMLFLGQNGYRVIAHDRRGHG